MNQLNSIKNVKPNNSATFTFGVIAKNKVAAVKVLKSLPYVKSHCIEEKQPFSDGDQLFTGTLMISGKDENDLLDKIAKHVQSEHFEPYYTIMYQEKKFEEHYSFDEFPPELAAALGISADD